MLDVINRRPIASLSCFYIFLVWIGWSHASASTFHLEQMLAGFGQLNHLIAMLYFFMAISISLAPLAMMKTLQHKTLILQCFYGFSAMVASTQLILSFYLLDAWLASVQFVYSVLWLITLIRAGFLLKNQEPVCPELHSQLILFVLITGLARWISGWLVIGEIGTPAITLASTLGSMIVVAAIMNHAAHEFKLIWLITKFKLPKHKLSKQ